MLRAVSLLVVVAALAGRCSDRLEPLPDRPTFYEDGSYAFVSTQTYDAGVPVTWDHCRPIEVVLNPYDAPPGAEALVRDALRDLEQVSAFRFTWGGLRSQRPAPGRRTGPVLVSFSTRDETARMTEGVAGLGGSSWSELEGTRAWFRTGEVTLSASYFTLLHDRGETGLMRAVVLHELGHVLGLDHVESTEEIMNGEAGGTLQLGHGDLTGLAKLGSQPCRT